MEGATAANLLQLHAQVTVDEVSERCGRRVTLGGLPGPVLDDLARFDWVYLLGVWACAPAAASKSERVLREAGVDPSWARPSPFAVSEYRVDDSLGGEEELAKLRAQLAARAWRPAPPAPGAASPDAPAPQAG